MATSVTLNISDAQEVELIALAQEYSAAHPEDQRSPSQHLRNFVRDWLDLSITQRAEAVRVRRNALYKVMTPEDQAVVDAVFNKYR